MSDEKLIQIQELIESAKVVSVVDGHYKLRDTAEAFRYFGRGEHKGKVVITKD